MTMDDTIYNLLEEWIKSGKYVEISFRDWLVEQGVDLNGIVKDGV